MIPFPHIDPVIFTIGPFRLPWIGTFGPLEVRWYGLMYVIGFVCVFSLVRHQIKKFGLGRYEPHLDNLNLVLIISLVLGGRLGYVLFYNLGYYLKHPAEILATWHGGMSFHGGMLGVLLGGYIFCRVKKLDFLEAADLYVVPLPIGLGLGRIGNFINGELYGRVTEAPWGMVFPDGGPLPRHPSQLYEALLEGGALFVILWLLKDKRWPSGSMIALFLLFYGLFRIAVEFFREPDAQLGFMWGGATMGQLLSSLMVAAGMTLFVWARRRGNHA